MRATLSIINLLLINYLGFSFFNIILTFLIKFPSQGWFNYFCNVSLYKNTSVKFWVLKQRKCEYFHFILLDSLMMAIILQLKHAAVFFSVNEQLWLDWIYCTFQWMSGTLMFAITSGERERERERERETRWRADKRVQAPNCIKDKKSY